MSDYKSNVDLGTAAALLARSRRVLVTTHAKPDGDAIGCVIALTAALRDVGKRADAWVTPPIPTTFDHLRGRDLVRPYENSSELVEPDQIVLLDTGAWAQLESMQEYLRHHLDHLLILDHHTSGDIPAVHRYIDIGAAACAQIVTQLLDELSPPNPSGTSLFSPTVCDALYVGLASDTGWFRFSNTSPQAYRLAARLLESGVDHSRIYRILEQTERPEKLALLTRALDSLELHADGRIALMVLRSGDFDETGAVIEETDRLIDIPQAVSTVSVVVMISEPPPNGDEPSPVRMSLRSKPGDRAVDVAKLAQTFGGGGHARAAGAKVYEPLDQVVARVCEAVTMAISAS